MRRTLPATVESYSVLGPAAPGGGVPAWRAVGADGAAVLLRLLPPDGTADADFARARMGAWAAARHPLLVPPDERLVVDGDVLVVERAPAGTAPLSGLLAAGPLPPALALHIGAGLCAAVASWADGVGAPHLAVRPDAIHLAADGVVFLGGPALGHFPPALDAAWLAPEAQRARSRPGPAADLFSLGAVLAAALCGAAPVGGDGGARARQRAHKAALAGAVERVRGLVPGLEGVLYALLHPDPKHRPARAAEVEGALREALAAGSAGDGREELAVRVGAALGSGPALVRAPAVGARGARIDDLLDGDDGQDVLDAHNDNGVGDDDDDETTSRGLDTGVFLLPAAGARAGIVDLGAGGGRGPLPQRPPPPAAEDPRPGYAPVPATGPTWVPTWSVAEAAPEASALGELPPAPPPVDAPPSDVAEPWDALPPPPPPPPPEDTAWFPVPAAPPPVVAPPSEAAVPPRAPPPAPPPEDTAWFPVPAAPPPVVAPPVEGEPVGPPAPPPEDTAWFPVPAAPPPVVAPPAATAPAAPPLQRPPPPVVAPPVAAAPAAPLPAPGGGRVEQAPSSGAAGFAWVGVAAAALLLLVGGVAWWGAGRGAPGPGTAPAVLAGPARTGPGVVLGDREPLPADAPRSAAALAAAPAPDAAPDDAAAALAAPEPMPASPAPVRAAAVLDASPRRAPRAARPPAAAVRAPAAEPAAAPAAVADVSAEAAPAPAAPAAGLDLGLDLDALASVAEAGRLPRSDRAALSQRADTGPDPDIAELLLLLDARARGDESDARRWVGRLLGRPEHTENPLLLVEGARLALNAGRFADGWAAAEVAERQWARLPSDVVFAKQAEIFEIQARAAVGLFAESGDKRELDRAVGRWERLAAHAAARPEPALAARANAEAARLEAIRARLP